MIGVLLVQTGTPRSYEIADIKEYLEQFLSDRRLVDLPAWKWKPILHGIILRKRPQKTAERYRAYWTDEGSPYIITCLNQAHLLEEELNKHLKSPRFTVQVAMRYGQPSIEEQIDKFVHAGVTNLIVLPMYAQYASVTTGTIIEEVYRCASRYKTVPSVRVIPHFCEHQAYIDCLAQSIHEKCPNPDYVDALVCSFHSTLCSDIDAGDIYEQQVTATVSALEARLGTAWSGKVKLGYQSVFDKREWLLPLTQDVLKELADKGRTRVAVCAPIFVTDCLETFWDIETEMKQEFESISEHHRLTFVPGLNCRDSFIALIKDLVVHEAMNFSDFSSVGESVGKPAGSL